MVQVHVRRAGGSNLSEDDPIYYDETVLVTIDVVSGCDAHVSAAVCGQLPDRREKLVITILESTITADSTNTIELHVRYPRSPLQNPQLEIIATAITTSVQHEDAPDLELLPAFEPVVPIALGAVDSFDAVEWNLGQSHVSTGASSSSVSLNSTTQPSSPNITEEGTFRAGLIQAIELGMCCVRPVLEKDRLIAELNISCAHSVQLAKCSLEIDDGNSVLCGSPSLPIELDSGSSFSICYGLQTLTMSVLRKTLNVNLEYTVRTGVEPEPAVSTIWKPVVDFDDAQGPLPKTPTIAVPSPGASSQGMVVGMSGSAASQLGPSIGTSMGGLTSARGSSASLSQLAGPSMRLSQPILSGVSLLISGPTTVSLGNIFEWSIKAINRSSRTRKLALTFGNSTAAPLTTVAEDRRTIAPNLESLRKREEAWRKASGASRGIIPMCNEIRIGSLPSNACFESRIPLLGLKKGIHTVESATAVDLATGDFYEIGSLLEVVVT